MAPRLSIVIPAYNESERIVRTISDICEYLNRDSYVYEIVLVDDHSKDDTVNIVTEMIEKYPSVKILKNEVNRGKGYSVRQGVLYSTGELVLMSDADLSTPIQEIEKLNRHINEGYDIAIGSRALARSEILKRQPWYRQLMGQTFNKIVQIVAVWGINDTQCGFKLFRGEAARRVFAAQKIDRFAFDVETLFIAKKAGYKIKEVPVQWINSPNSRVRIVRDSFRMLIDIFRIRFLL